MSEKKKKVVAHENGKVTIEDADIRQGDELEVSIRWKPAPPTRSLRGLPVRYRDPFGPAVDPSEWDAER